MSHISSSLGVPFKEQLKGIAIPFIRKEVATILITTKIQNIKRYQI